MKILSLLTLFTFLCTTPMYSQLLDNPSFEGEPMDAVTPARWMPCNEYTTPDILPGPWGVYLEASHGNTYAGLITRINGTTEGIGQKTPVEIKSNNCYTLTMDLAHSYSYAGYTHPSKCKVWLCNSPCVKDQLIIETDIIAHNYWKTYTWDFTPEKDYNYIIIEAYYPDGTELTKGNILIDNIRPVKRCEGA